MSHRCPAIGCERLVPDNKLMCPSDWYKIPKPIRNAVWRTWNRGAGAGSIEHLHAMGAAIRSLTRRQEDK